MADQGPQEGELILYRNGYDAVRIEVLNESETFWRDQRRTAELFGVDIRTVSYRVKEVYASGELSLEVNLRRNWRVPREGNHEVRCAIECQARMVESTFATEVERTESKRAKKAPPSGEQNP